MNEAKEKKRHLFTVDLIIQVMRSLTTDTPSCHMQGKKLRCVAFLNHVCNSTRATNIYKCCEGHDDYHLTLLSFQSQLHSYVSTWPAVLLCLKHLGSVNSHPINQWSPTDWPSDKEFCTFLSIGSLRVIRITRQYKL